MKILVFVGMMLAATASFGSDCACTAPTGRCTVNASCPRGCFAVCGEKGCRSGGLPPGLTKGTDDGKRLTYSGEAVSVASLQEKVRRELGARLYLVPRQAGDRLKIDLHDVTAAELVPALSGLGAVAVVPADGEAKSLRFDLKAENVEAATLVTLLRQMFGPSVSVQAANPRSEVSLELKSTRLADLRKTLPKVTGVRILSSESSSSEPSR